VLCSFSDEEWDTLPHVILTGDADWDPGVLDQDLDDNEAWFDTISDLPPDKPPLHLMRLVTTPSRLSFKAIMFCIVATPPNTLWMQPCVIIHTYQAHAENNCCISEHHDPDDTALEDQHPLYDLMPMRSASILLAISHSGPCLDGFLLM